ncbi:MAG: DUF192 domain-containing protein [Myxococcota bacterium]
MPPSLRASAPAAVLAALMACTPSTPEERPTPTPAQGGTPESDEGEAPSVETPRVVFSTRGGPVVVVAEVVDTPDSRARGLMFRESLPEGAGMLFVFEERRRHTFWMKNTLIPLDMIFIDDAAGRGEPRVVGVVHRAEPRTLRTRGVDRPSRWVVEVPGGFAREHGIREGVRVRFQGLP